MNLKSKTIFTGFAPNLIKDDFKIALSFLFVPWQWPSWHTGKYTEKTKEDIKNYFGVKQTVLFDSGRSALYFALKALDLKSGDEVLVQTYTCVVVINAIKWAGAIPIYVDVTDDFNMDLNDLKNKLSKNSRAVIIQHTFGKPAVLSELLQIAKKHNLFTIEDCAHSLGAIYNGQLLGTFGDIGMLSFGSDKIISCARGGALIGNNELLMSKIESLENSLPQLPKYTIFQHLIHFIIFYITKPVYHLGLGKIILAIAKKINLLNKIIYQEEKRGVSPKIFPAKFPNALAKILHNKFNQLPDIIKHQQKIAKLYDQKINNQSVIKPEWNESSVWLRYTILLNNPNKLHAQAKTLGVILGNWYNSPIAPEDIDNLATGYKTGLCPNDEKLAKMSLNLPTDININELEAERIIKIINNYV